MGDQADYLIEQGMDEWMRHKSGDCDVDCRYCWEEGDDNGLH